MSKIQSISVTNLRAITEQNLTLNGCTAIIIGGNGQGKSTLCRALMDRMRSIKNDLIVRDGQKEGRYEMDLTTGERFVWEVRADGKEKMTFFSERDVKGQLTKDLCQHYFPKVFDVDKFLTDEPAKQTASLQKLSKLDFTEVDRLLKAAEEERTWANRRLAEAKAKEILFEPNWTDTPRVIEHVEKELQGIDAHNLQYATIQKGLEEKKKLKERNDQEIAELKAKIEKIEQDNALLSQQIEGGEKWIGTNKNKPKDDAVRVKLQTDLADARANNAAIIAREELRKCEKNAIDAETEVQKIRNDKAEMIRLADMPEGFSFGEDGGIAYNGRPFDRKCLASSEIYIGALKLAARQLGTVKAIHFDAGMLDKNSLLAVNEWAEGQGLQLLIERPDWEGGEIRYEIIENVNE